jgi:hypothetical protein
LHGGIAVNGEAVGNGELAGLGLGDFASVGAESDVDFVGTLFLSIVVEDLEKALRVKGAAGAGDGHDEFHADTIHRRVAFNKEGPIRDLCKSLFLRAPSS